MTIIGPSNTPIITDWCSLRTTHISEVVDIGSAPRGLESINIKLKATRETYEDATLINPSFSGNADGWVTGAGATYYSNYIRLDYNVAYTKEDYLYQVISGYITPAYTEFRVTLDITSVVGQDIDIYVTNLAETETLSVTQTFPAGTTIISDIVIGTTTTAWDGLILWISPTADTSVYPIPDASVNAVSINHSICFRGDVYLTVEDNEGIVYHADTPINGLDISIDATHIITASFTFSSPVRVEQDSALRLVLSYLGDVTAWDDSTLGSMAFIGVGADHPSVYADGYAEFFPSGGIEWNYDIPNGSGTYTQDSTDLWFELFWSDTVPDNLLTTIDWTCDCNLQSYQNGVNLAALQDICDNIAETLPITITVFGDTWPTTSQWKAWYEDRGFDLPMRDQDKLHWMVSSAVFGQHMFYLPEQDVTQKGDRTYWKCRKVNSTETATMFTETIPYSAAFPASPLELELDLQRDSRVLLHLVIKTTGITMSSNSIIVLQVNVDTVEYCFNVCCPTTVSAKTFEAELDFGVLTEGIHNFEIGLHRGATSLTALTAIGNLTWEVFYQ